MIKNNYLLLLISDVLENIGTKKVFTKIDLRWEYNNMWIKETSEKQHSLHQRGLLNQQ